MGRPLVLLSGGPGISSDYFLPLIDSLKNSYRIILPDQRGTGKSCLFEYNNNTLNTEKYIEDLEIIRQELEIESWTLLGHSWGGVLAMAYEAQHPNWISSMILVGSGGIIADYFKYYPSNIQARLSLDERERLKYWQTPEIYLKNPHKAILAMNNITVPAMVFDRTLIYSLIDDLVTPETMNTDIILIMNGQWFTTGYDYSSKLKSYPGPVTIIQGRQDPVGESTVIQIKEVIPTIKH